MKAPAGYCAIDYEDPIPEQVRARIPSLRELSERYREEEKKRKRDYSDSSMSHEQLAKELEEKIEKRITACISLYTLYRDQRNEEVKELTDSKDILRKDQYTSVRKDLEEQVNQISLKLIGLKRRKNEIKGEILDRSVEYRYYKDVNILIDYIIENAITTYKITPIGYTILPAALQKENRKSRTQSNFRRMLVEFYSAEPPPNEEKSSSDEDELSYNEDKLSRNEDLPEFSRGLWCPISKRYSFGEQMAAAHIVPHSIGEISCSYLFNERYTTGHLFNPKNGLLIHSFFEKAIDKAQIAIVPVEGDILTSNLKVVVLDQAILKRNLSPAFDFDWKSLHGLQLEFRNENRPGLRYLYFNFLVSTFRRRRLEYTGWRSDLSRYAEGKMWGSPGKWLRGSSVRAIARRVGHEPDLESFLDTTNLPLEDDDGDDNFDDELFAEETILKKKA